MKKNYKSRQILELQIHCPRHEDLLITHGCLNMECHSDPILFCSSCLLENLEHITNQQKFISPLPSFLNGIYEFLSEIKENMEPIEQMNLENDFSFMHKQLKEKRNEVDNELNQIKIKIIKMIENIQQVFSLEFGKLMNEIEKKQKNIEGSQVQKIMKFNFKNKDEFFKEIKFLNIYDLEKYFKDVRKCFNSQNYEFYSYYIEEIKNSRITLERFLSKVNKVNFSDLQKVINEQYFFDLEAKIKQNFVYEENFDKFTMNSNSNSETEMTPIKLQNFNQSSIKKNVSPLLMNKNSVHKFFPQNIDKTISSEIKSSKITDLFQKMNKLPNLNICETSQKNFIIKDDIFFKKEKFLLDIELEAFFDEQYPVSSLCTVDLNENLLIVGGKDNKIKIFQLQTYSNNNTHIKLLKTFENVNDQSAIWSLAKLSAINYQKNDYGIYYFASGSESGNISIWKLNCQNLRVTENSNSPMIELIGDINTEIITCIVDLNNGNHLVCGDSKGNIMLWDFLYGKLIQSFERHKDQINNIVNYMNFKHLAVASYDGNISLWDVLQKNDNKIEIVCKKIIKNNFPVYSLNSLNTRNDKIIVVDSQKKLKILDISSVNYVQETQIIKKSEAIIDILVMENFGNQNCPLIFCFTTSNLIIVDGDSLEPIKTINLLQIQNVAAYDIGVTMNSNYKIVFISKSEISKGQNENFIYFAMVDQSPKTTRIVSIFKIVF